MDIKHESRLICAFDTTFEIVNETKSSCGSFCLIQHEKTYYFRWLQNNGNFFERFSLSLSNVNNFAWDYENNFVIPCNNFSFLILHENPNHFLLKLDENTVVRRFFIETDSLNTISCLINQLLINGIAFPCKNPHFSFGFYRNCKAGCYPLFPSTVAISFQKYKSRKELWIDSLDLMVKVLSILFDCQAVPNDLQFPLLSIIVTFHSSLLVNINEFIKAIPPYAEVTCPLNNFLDSEGRIEDFSQLKRRIYFGGIRKNFINGYLPFLLGIYDSNSTYDERIDKLKVLTEEFQIYREQMELLSNEQINRCEKIYSSFRIISQDVNRTERKSRAFCKLDGIGAKILTLLLKTFVIYHPIIGYLQGMSDIIVPIILSFLPDWDENCVPVNYPDILNQNCEVLAMIFWCFEASLRKSNHIQFLKSVTQECTNRAKVINNILSIVSPITGHWMRYTCLDSLIWCFSDFVLLFKRTFTDIWALWIQCYSFENSDQYYVLFMTAIIISVFPNLESLPDLNITTLMDLFPKLMASCDLSYIGKIIHWIYHETPVVLNNQSETDTFELPHFISNIYK